MALEYRRGGKGRYVETVECWKKKKRTMQLTAFKRLGKRVLDSTLVPISNYVLNPIIAKLNAQLDQIDQTSAKSVSVLEQIATKICSQPHETSSPNVHDIQSSLRNEIEKLRAYAEMKTPNNPCVHGFKVYAQTDEDGIIEYILDKLPGHSKTFIEIGCGDGIENNTHYLALKGYQGCWVDASDENIARIENALGALKFDNLIVEKQVVSKENIGALITELCAFLKTPEPTFFSLDIDGNDFHVLKEAIKYFRPLVICTEYNGKFPPPFIIVTQYDPAQIWARDDYHGASLQAFCDLLSEYKLVTCNLSGVNAFFVRHDHSASFADYAPKQLYQPFRVNLVELQSYHPSSLKWLKDKLR